MALMPRHHLAEAKGQDSAMVKAVVKGQDEVAIKVAAICLSVAAQGARGISVRSCAVAVAYHSAAVSVVRRV